MCLLVDGPFLWTPARSPIRDRPHGAMPFGRRLPTAPQRSMGADQPPWRAHSNGPREQNPDANSGTLMATPCCSPAHTTASNAFALVYGTRGTSHLSVLTSGLSGTKCGVKVNTS